jgi:hypothetical protein
MGAEPDYLTGRESGDGRGATRSDDTCGYHDDHDELDRPRGNRCGKPRTQVVDWRDGRWSNACDEHAAEIAREVPGLILRIRPIAEKAVGRG